MRYVLTLILMLPFLAAPLTVGAAEADPKLAQQALAVLEKNCYRCHGAVTNKEKNIRSKKGKVDYILDAKKLIAEGKIVPRQVEKSIVFQRITDADEPMPPSGEEPRPSATDIGVIKKWIEAGAPDLPPLTSPKTVDRPFISQTDVYQAMNNYLAGLHPETARYQRFFSLTNLYNNEKIEDGKLRLYRAALSKLLNSLSWRRAIVLPKSIDLHGVVLAFDLRDLDWDLNDQWQLVVAHTAREPKNAFHPGYPYALKHQRYPEDEALNNLALNVYKMTGTEIPLVRADWFLATASVPPLYHDLLQIPRNARDLEAQLRVNVKDNFLRDRAARAAFERSGVSANANRMIERHEAAYGNAKNLSDDLVGLVQKKPSLHKMGLSTTTPLRRNGLCPRNAE